MLLHQILYILLLAVVALLLLGVLIRQLQYAQYLWGQRVSSRQNDKPSGKVSHSYRTDRGNKRLQNRLLTLLHGDSATARRLLLQQQQRHPGKSDNWYLEKVIYDLERDRRR